MRRRLIGLALAVAVCLPGVLVAAQGAGGRPEAPASAAPPAASSTPAADSRAESNVPEVHAAANAAQPDAETAETAAYLAEARELYAWHCAVCHGATGGGLAEARQAFPADHRDCTRCHRPSNRVVQPLDQPFNDNDMFAIGDPPALHGTSPRQPLAAVAEPDQLHAYLATTMPRYDPGRLADDEYWALTALLLAMNGRDEAAAQVAGARRP